MRLVWVKWCFWCSIIVFINFLNGNLLWVLNIIQVHLVWVFGWWQFGVQKFQVSKYVITIQEVVSIISCPVLVYTLFNVIFMLNCNQQFEFWGENLSNPSAQYPWSNSLPRQPFKDVLHINKSKIHTQVLPKIYFCLDHWISCNIWRVQSASIM